MPSPCPTSQAPLSLDSRTLRPFALRGPTTSSPFLLPPLTLLLPSIKHFDHRACLCLSLSTPSLTHQPVTASDRSDKAPRQPVAPPSHAPQASRPDATLEEPLHTTDYIRLTADITPYGLSPRSAFIIGLTPFYPYPCPCPCPFLVTFVPTPLPLHPIPNTPIFL